MEGAVRDEVVRVVLHLVMRSRSSERQPGVCG
jgi:hypothetical protein